MTDLEITKRCAEAMGHEYIYVGPEMCIRTDKERDAYTKIPMYRTIYDPLHDDAQAMALVKKIGLHIVYRALHIDTWRVDKADKYATANDLNYAICECVAKMKEAA